MTPKEADKIIAEFMGFEFAYGEQGYTPIYCEGIVSPDISRAGPSYSGSLDALVPVWEKMKADKILFDRRAEVFYVDTYGTKIAYAGDRLFIEPAAAIATAKAILELKGEG